MLTTEQAKELVSGIRDNQDILRDFCMDQKGNCKDCPFGTERTVSYGELMKPMNGYLCEIEDIITL